MTHPKINARLLVSILVVTVFPMAAALYLVDKAVTTSLNLGFNSEIIDVLEADSRNLKSLGRLDPGNLASYRVQFDKVESMKAIYSAPEVIKTSVSRSLLVYFSLGVAVALLISVSVATLLSRQISRAYRDTFDELARQRERIRYLEEISSWQEFAKILAHEIKNPLTPIQVMVTSLVKSYREQPPADFAEQLDKSETMIVEELAHLNNTVNKFSDFAKLPAVDLKDVSVSEWIVQQIGSLEAATPGAAITFSDSSTSPLYARIDETLLRRVLANILRNGVEANPRRAVQFAVALSASDDTLAIRIGNNGVPVPEELAPRIFDPYITGKSGNDNMGLGLAIVRKIVIEHGGDISFEQTGQGPVFVISLPRRSS